ncbi:MAG TPA: hypothetical protein VJY35_10785 [Candidatus Eisenbacteria bacterium]|nr:hypothetical protein [Candidatus Eisenbacteria bacterium]
MRTIQGAIRPRFVWGLALISVAVGVLWMTRWWLMFVFTIAVNTLSFGLLAYKATARYRFPDSDRVLAIRLHQSHPVLAEFDRVLVLEGGTGPQPRVDLWPDTGGYALVNLYRLGPQRYVVTTQGNRQYLIDVAAGTVDAQPIAMTHGAQPRPAGAEFVGAFNFVSDSWRFSTAAESPEREVGTGYTGP